MDQINYRYRIDIEYDGTNYYGFQKQRILELKTIESALLIALKNLVDHEVKIFVSGRTDAGVHALCQTIHIDLKKNFNPYKLKNALNFYLRKNYEKISVLNCISVNTNFHARLSAKLRYYRYQIINRDYPLTIDQFKAWHIINPINIDKMIIASKDLIGSHDFTSFRDSDCQSKSPIKTIEKIEINKFNQLIIIDVNAKSFLHHMVRNIVGTLVYFGLDKYTNITMNDIINARDRSKSGPNAPACGLYFLRTDY